MSKLEFKRFIRFIVLLPAFLVLVMTSCVDGMDKNAIYAVSSGYMIDEYVQSTADLSTCNELIQMSSFSGMLHGYGSYTFFAPTNEAFATYLTSIGKTDITQLTKGQADTILMYHVIRDSIKTTEFEDGRLSSPTISGRYLTNKTISDSLDNIFIRMNRQGNITIADFHCDNGLVHVVDAVLTPPTKNIISSIQALPDSLFSVSKYLTLKFSRFCPDSMSVSALESGRFTYFAQDNQSYVDLGIGITQSMVDNTLVDSLSRDSVFSSIKQKLLNRLRKNQPDVKSDTALLNQFCDYHFISSIRYIGDLLNASALETTIKNQSLTFKLKGLNLLVNYYEIGSTIEPGVSLNRESIYSDLACSNGVIQYLGGHIELKNRSAFRVYWELSAQPECMALKDFRRSGTTVAYMPADLSEVEWGGRLVGSVTYTCGGAATSTSLDTKNQYSYGDMMRFRCSPNLNVWMEWKLPLLVTGKYKVWVCWRREGTTSTFRSIFKQDGKDDQVLPYVFNLGEYYPGGTIEENLANGWKIYPAKGGTGGVMNSRLLGTIVVEATGRHLLRIEGLAGGNDVSWDMIQFIPVDEDQLWPRVDIRGKWCYPTTPDCEIWPYTYKVSSNFQGTCFK